MEVHSQDGYTFIELLITIVLVLILVVVGIYVYKKHGKYANDNSYTDVNHVYIIKYPKGAKITGYRDAITHSEDVALYTPKHPTQIPAVLTTKVYNQMTISEYKVSSPKDLPGGYGIYSNDKKTSINGYTAWQGTYNNVYEYFVEHKDNIINFSFETKSDLDPIGGGEFDDSKNLTNFQNVVYSIKFLN